ncbi:MAG: hypothetical protein WCP58_04600 [bacterium]
MDTHVALRFLPGLLSFAVFGGLVTRRLFPAIGPVLLGGILGLLFGLSALALTGLLFALVRRRLAIASLLADASLWLVPFAVLALLAELLMGWDAAQPIALAGFLTAWGRAGLDLSQRSGGRSSPVFLSLFAAILLVAGWVLWSAAMGGLLR